MSPRRSRGLFTEFERDVLQATAADEGFKSRFAELSRDGDRAGMIASLLDALIASPSSHQVGDYYRGKDATRAEEFLRQLQQRHNNDTTEEDTFERTTGILTEALLCAPTRSRIFLDVVSRRARAWYRTGYLARCAGDCRFFAESLARGGCATLVPEDDRIDLLLLHAECCKILAAPEEARNYLNEAMRRINELARKQCGDGGGDEDERNETYKVKKAEILKNFLQRKQQLGDMRTLPDEVVGQTVKRIPELEGKVNEFLSCCSDAVAFGNDKTKGRLLYATRNIKPGSVLIVDRPFSFSSDIIAIHRNCLHCHVSLKLKDSVRIPCESCQAVQFCSDECRQQAWNKFHKYECRIFDYFYENKFQKTNCLLAYRTVVAAALHVQDNMLEIDEDFVQLHENDKNVLDMKSLTKYQPHDYKTVFNLETHCSHSEPKENFERAIHAIFFAKCLIYSLNYFHPDIDNHERHLHILAVALLHNMQAINCNAYEIVENIRDDETKILEPRNVGGAIYTSVSLTNHSCYPNIVRHSFSCGTVVVQSLRFIPQGSEILDCYGQHFLQNKRDSRRKLLAQKYYFKCQCEACTFDWPITLPNDQFNFKCKKCFKQCRRTRNTAECTACGLKTEISKLYTLLQNSIKKRLAALTKMYDGHYKDALPLLLEHANCIDKILSEPSLEAVKTQQSIIQCLNAMSSTSV